MGKTPQQNDSPEGRTPDSEHMVNPAQNNQGPKETAKKIVFKTDDPVPGLENLPGEASELFKNIMSKDLPLKNTASGQKEKVMMEAMTPEQTLENLERLPQMDQQTQDLFRQMVMPKKPPENLAPDLKQSPAKTGQLPKMPPPPPPSVAPQPPAAVIPENNDFPQRDVIIDEAGSIFGIKINQSKRKDIIEIMKTKSKVNNFGNDHTILKYDDVGINFHLGDSGFLQEITFSYPFEGATSKGLKIFDSINQAIKIYGQPRIRTQSGAMWDKISIFLTDDTIITIRLRSA